MSVDTSVETGQLAENVSGEVSLPAGHHRSTGMETAQVNPHEPTHPLADAVWSETAIAQSRSESNRAAEFNLTDAAWLLLPLWFAVVWVILFFAFSEGWRVTRHKLRIQPKSQIPCRHCRFYNSSAYLKCAVKPLDAATERAIGCSDYDSKQVEESSPSSQCSNDVKFR